MPQLQFQLFYITSPAMFSVWAWLRGPTDIFRSLVGDGLSHLLQRPPEPHSVTFQNIGTNLYNMAGVAKPQLTSHMRHFDI